MSSDALGIAGALQAESDTEDRELVRFENAESYFAKQSELLAAEVQRSERAGPLLEELVREVRVELTPDPIIPRTSLPARSISGTSCGSTSIHAAK